MELTSRGKKDAFFIQNPAYTWFDPSYERRSATTRTVLTQLPSAPAQFGSWVEIELPRTADVLKHVDIRITLPTWLPPEIAAINGSQRVEIESEMQHPLGGQALGRYGWTNGVGDIAIEKWELYADTTKICEGYGQTQSVYFYTKTTQARAPIYHERSGYHAGTDMDIQRAATPPTLACRLPLPGCQWEASQGLPLCALLGQRVFLRIRIAPKERLVESSALWTTSGLPVFDICPRPWGSNRIFVNGDYSGKLTLPEWEVGQPYVEMRCTVLHLEEEARRALCSKPISIPYTRYLYDVIKFDTESWQPGNQIAKQLDIHGFFDAIYLRFWHETRDRQNKYRDSLTAAGADWVSDISLIVNSVERIYLWDPKKLRQLSNNTQVARDVEDSLFYMIFGQPKDHEPAGSLFLSRTHKAVLRFTINALPTDPAARSRFIYIYLMGVAWNILDIEGGQARVRFAD